MILTSDFNRVHKQTRFPEDNQDQYNANEWCNTIWKVKGNWFCKEVMILFPQATYIQLTHSNQNVTVKVLNSMSIKYQSGMLYVLDWFLINTDLRVFPVYNILGPCVECSCCKFDSSYYFTIISHSVTYANEYLEDSEGFIFSSMI